MALPNRSTLTAPPPPLAPLQTWTVGEARAKIAAACGLSPDARRCRLLKVQTYGAAPLDVFLDDEQVCPQKSLSLSLPYPTRTHTHSPSPYSLQ